MIRAAQDSIDSAFAFVLERLVHKSTHQIYDYRTSEGEDGAFCHLPTPEEIKSCIPNPCGWFSGMEDTDICGGMMLDALLYRYELTGDASLEASIERIYSGLMLNTRVSEQEGFLARSVHPCDKKSHYINPSRDQYTHWIYAMVHFLNSPLCDEEKREEIKNALVGFAKKAEHDVIEENEYRLLREDGKPALVCRMLGKTVASCEANRLPMIYAVAYRASGDSHWLKMYHKYRDITLEKAERHEKGSCSMAFPIMQGQHSLRLLYEIETDESYRERYLRVMRLFAEDSERFVLEAAKRLRDYKNPSHVVSWRDCPKEHRHLETVSHGCEVWLNNVYDASIGEAENSLRNVSEGFVTQTLCPGYDIKPEQIKAFCEVVSGIDFALAYNHFPVSFCNAFWGLQKHIQ